MTQENFEKAEKLNKELIRLRKQRNSINVCIEYPVVNHGDKFQNRFFCRFSPRSSKRNGQKFDTPNGDSVYVFFPERAVGIEVDLDLDFVLLLRGHLDKKIKTLQDEMDTL